MKKNTMIMLNEKSLGQITTSFHTGKSKHIYSQ